MIEKRTLVSFDWAIKNILRDKANYDVLEGFLSTLLEKDITILKLLESESNQQYENDKFNRVDVVVEDENKDICVIEIQNSWERFYLQRLLYGSSKLIVDHLKLGESFENVKKVISISILYFLLGEGESDYIYKGTTDFYGLNTNEELKLRPEKRQAILGHEIQVSRSIFPEYYLIEVERFHNIIRNGIDEWVYFFKNSEVPTEFKSKNIQAAAEKLDFLKMPEEQRRAYEKYLTNKASEKDMIETARLEGRADGREEASEKFAIRSLKDGLPVEKVAAYTGLSLERVQELARELQ